MTSTLQEKLQRAHSLFTSFSVCNGLLLNNDVGLAVLEAVVKTEKGDYSAHSSLSIPDFCDSTVMRARQDEAVSAALDYALFVAKAPTDVVAELPELQELPELPTPTVIVGDIDEVDQSLLCEECNLVILPYWSGTKYISQQEIAEMTMQSKGRSLCWGCKSGRKPKLEDIYG